jgi:hypothetical protein
MTTKSFIFIPMHHGFRILFLLYIKRFFGHDEVISTHRKYSVCGKLSTHSKLKETRYLTVPK